MNWLRGKPFVAFSWTAASSPDRVEADFVSLLMDNASGYHLEYPSSEPRT